jgi:hypothetical protein
MITELMRLQDWQVLLLSLGVWVPFALILAFVFHRALPKESRERASIVSAAYMTAFGSLFAILTAFLINAEYTSYRAAQSAIGAEVAAADQLASATAGLPPADAERIQALLVTYLKDVVRSDWEALGYSDASLSPAASSLRALQQEVFARGSRDYISPPVAETVQSAANAIVSARRERAVIADATLPLPLFGIALIAGVALVVNGLLVASRYSRRYAFVAAGIVLAVALDLGAIIVISGPFQGGLTVSPQPFVQLAQEIARGEHLPWVAS